MMNGKDRAVWSASDGNEPVVTLNSGLYNGRLLTVLPCSANVQYTEQLTKQCLEYLQDCGIQIPVEESRHFLQIPVLIPEVHRYIFFSSRFFGMILATILYIAMWVNLYSTIQMFMDGHSWLISLPVTLAAVFVTAVIILVLNQEQRKINTNTDIMLAAANESFMKYDVLLGISTRSQICGNGPSLCFIYFHLLGCQQRLSQRLASMHQDDVRHCLGKLFIVIEIPADPMLAPMGTGVPATEQSSLLANNSTHKPVLCSRKIPLVEWDEPDVMARQLLVIASACYVRLLISGKLPKACGAGHTGVLDVPCPCQFIEGAILTSGSCVSCM